MVLRRWDPILNPRRMDETMDRLWGGLGWRRGLDEGIEAWSIPLDVVDEGETIVVKASLPGIDPDDIQVSIENDVLTIKGHIETEQETKEEAFLMRERRSGSFHRSLRLPDAIDADKAEPIFENGVLTVSFPKQEAKKVKTLRINAKS